MTTSGESSPELQLSSEVLQGIHVLRASGEVDLSVKEQFERRIDEAVEGAHSPLVIDLTDVRYMDSSGLNVLARAQRRMTARNDRLCIVLQDPHLQKVFEMMGFDKLFRIYQTLDHAIAAATDSIH